MIELLKIGSASMQKRALKLAKRRLGTQKRGKRRRDEIAGAAGAMRRKGHREAVPLGGGTAALTVGRARGMQQKQKACRQCICLSRSHDRIAWPSVGCGIGCLVFPHSLFGACRGLSLAQQAPVSQARACTCESMFRPRRSHGTAWHIFFAQLVSHTSGGRASRGMGCRGAHNCIGIELRRRW